MNPANRDMAVEPGWDARTSVDTMIQAAPYAVLKDDEVLLVIDTEGETLNGVTLTNERGLHYDADTTVRKALVQRKVEQDEWSLSRHWKAAEQYLA